MTFININKEKPIIGKHIKVIYDKSSIAYVYRTKNKKWLCQITNTQLFIDVKQWKYE